MHEISHADGGQSGCGSESQAEEEGRGEAVEEAFEASDLGERHGAHTLNWIPGGAGRVRYLNNDKIIPI